MRNHDEHGCGLLGLAAPATENNGMTEHKRRGVSGKPAGRGMSLVLLACWLLFGLGLAPAGDMQLTEKAQMLLDYQSYVREDRDNVVRFNLSVVRDLQGTPLAELAARIALFYEPAGLSSVSVGEAEARRALGPEADLSPELRDLLRRFVARSLAAAGRREEAKELHRRRGIALSWLIAGPLPNRRLSGGGTQEFPTTGGILERDVIAEPPDEALFREWRKNAPWRFVPENRTFPFVHPWRWSGRPAKGPAAMFTGLEMRDADNQASFHVYSDVSWRLYVDGVLVSEVDRNKAEAPTEHFVPYSLTAGNHAVFLHLQPPPEWVNANNVRVALRLESNAPFSWNREAAKPDPFKPENSRREARPPRYLNELRDMARESPSVMGAYAVACLEQGMLDEASWWAEAAARAAPGEVNLQYMAGILTSLNPLLPEERRRNIAVAWHRAALSANPELVPSLLFMARISADAGRVRDAAEFLERAYAVNPSSIAIMLAKGEWAEKFASGGTSRAVWDESIAKFPESPAVQLAAASMPQEGFLDMDRRLAACRAAAAAGPYNPEAVLKLAEALADSGNAQEAEYILRDALELFDGEVSVLGRIADVYSRLGLHDEAVAAQSSAVRLVPDNDALWRRLGDLHMEAGREAEAEKFWNVSLAANPGQFELSDMMNYLSGRQDRLYDAGGYDAIAMTAETDAQRYPGDVVRLLDRSVLIFTSDGSYRRVTHSVDLAKNRRGGERLASIAETGELLTARIVFPNGNTLEPEPYPGAGGLRLPIIMPGASREILTLEASRAEEGAPPSIPSWLFQDPSGRMPLLISEYIVRTPRNFPLVYSVRNLGNEVEFDMSREDDFDVYRWRANLSLPSREPDAVDVSERVPSVEVGVKTTWEEVAAAELQKLGGRLIPSMRMRSLLSSLYQNTPEAQLKPLDAAAAIYRYVCDNIDLNPATRPSAVIAAHIHADRTGDRGLLLLALLRAAGFDAEPAAARPSSEFMHPPVWELPKREIFTIPLVRLSLPGGQVYWLDVRYESLPFGKVADDLSGATVLTFSADGPLFETIPNLPAEESIVFVERTMQLPEKGRDELIVTGRSLRRGVEGLKRDEELSWNDLVERKRLFLASVYSVFPDAVLRRFDKLHPEQVEAASQERYEISSKWPLERRPDGSRAIGLCLTPLQVVSEEARKFSKRQTSCHIKAVHMAEDRNTFVLPPGGQFTEAPESAHIPSRFGTYQLRVIPRGANGVEVIRNYHIPAQRVPPWDWEDFLQFLESVELAEKQWVEYAIE